MELEQNISQPSSRLVDTKLIYRTVTVLVVLLIINPAWIDNGGFGSGVGILSIGWLGILLGIISWYWFIGYRIFVGSLKSGSFWNWNLIKKVILILFFVVCSFQALGSIRLGQIAPQDIDCGCREIKQLGAGYFLYQILLWYLITLVVSLSIVKKSDESTKKIIKTVSFIALGLGIAVMIPKIPLIFIQFGE